MLRFEVVRRAELPRGSIGEVLAPAALNSKRGFCQGHMTA